MWWRVIAQLRADLRSMTAQRDAAEAAAAEAARGYLAQIETLRAQVRKRDSSGRFVKRSL